MNTTDSNDKSKPRRRRGLLADELAKDAQVSRYKAKQAIWIKKNVPELVPYIVSGEVTLKDFFRALRQRQKPLEPELTFDEEVERRFKHWLSRWPKEDRREVLDIVELMPLAKFVDLMPANFAVDFGLETKKRKQP